MHISTSPLRRSAVTHSQGIEQTILAALSGIPVLAPLAERPMAELLAMVSIRFQDDGAPLFSQGDASDSLYLVLEGEVVLSASAFSGGESTVIGIVQAGECFGEEAFLGHQRLVNARAGIVSQVMAIDPALVTRDDRSILEHVFRRLTTLMAEVAALKSVPPAQRLARLLMSMARQDEGAVTLPLPAMHKTMAGWVGVRPETFSSRVLPKLKAVGVSFDGNRIGIADLAALGRFAQSRSVMKGAR
ncbi:hypothetical protein CU669_18875 [Paramagnetospirillum kuznetsovii]|uniref:Cyclic nucleotide-binding domain-containing protein n=1 Tax=Paramagnetospirillum kuznetsovii TaxID=2053833 RepID=A0A364NTE2_9PROT|nr:Crp/Fnr family transcriptional regulator [Paramagnetospirillum kuznetsovii]RAU20312.1 hypothetical protein CU669_18875 [Paramagnetospirillum kuznetsovii]